LPNLAGLDIYVSDAVSTDQIPTSGRTETGLVGDGYAIVMKRGNTTGVTWVAEPLTVRRWAEEETRSVRVQLFKTFVPVIFRGKQISIISNI
jgi:hypothetical protein